MPPAFASSAMSRWARRSARFGLTAERASTQQCLNLPAQLRRIDVRPMPAHRLPAPPNQKFREIPRDPPNAEQSRLLVLEPLVKWMSVRAVDIDLGKHRKVDPIV